MANNYEEMVGTMRVKAVTPVIRALFGCYNLDESYPGNGEVYIARGEFMDRAAIWESLREDLKGLFSSLGLPFPAFADEEMGGVDVDVFGSNLAQIFTVLFKHFGTDQHPHALEHTNYMKSVDPYETPELKWLFELAALMDDGHGLESYQVDAAWYCSKPRLGEFGGWSEYQGPHYFAFSSSTVAGTYGPSINQAIADGQYGAAVNQITQVTERMLTGFKDPTVQRRVALGVSQKLNTVYNPIPATQEASNEPMGAALYETTPVVMTEPEQYEHLANAMAHIANTWAGSDKLSRHDIARGAIRDVLDMFEYGDGNSVPPMQLVPIPHPNGIDYTTAVWRDGVGSVPGIWNFHQPMNLIQPNQQSLSGTFDEIARRMEENRINAAKKMFGT
jgi:hypothetical protein